MKNSSVLIGLGVAAMVAVFAFFVFLQPGVHLNSQPLPGTTVRAPAPETADEAIALEFQPARRVAQ